MESVQNEEGKSERRARIVTRAPSIKERLSAIELRAKLLGHLSGEGRTEVLDAPTLYGEDELL